MADTAVESPAGEARSPATKEKLNAIASAASLQYSLKNFFGAADLYADASQIQAELNGDMAPENAELLFYYGRALYKVAVQKSDVLGAKVVQEEKKKTKTERSAKTAGEGSSAAADGATDGKEESLESKPYFQLTGDENWTDSEDEEDVAEGEGEPQEDEDDFQNAYEIFDLARVLYEKQLQVLDNDQTDGGKGKGTFGLTSQGTIIKAKLADCHGFLVEIYFENERFHDALVDARQSLALQEELHAFEHEAVTEAHYSLSLALEFASKTKDPSEQTGEVAANRNEANEANEASEEIDYELRNEAAKHTELAVQSLESRLKKEREGMEKADLTAEQKKEKATIFKDKADMLEDLKNRLTDLKQDPQTQIAQSIDPNLFQGLLGGLVGADAATQRAKIEEATSSANDISGLVKTRKKEKAPAPAPAAAPASSEEAGGSKRKLEAEESEANGKRAKTEEVV